MNSSNLTFNNINIVTDLFTLVETSFEVIESNPLDGEMANYLSERITASPTVWSRSPERLINQTANFPSICIYDKGNLIGFITVDIYDKDYHGMKVHERVALWVDDNYRDNNLGKYLMLKLTEKINDQPIASYTPNEKVGNISMKYLGFQEVKRGELSDQVVEILEMGGAIDDHGYKFYFNEVLMNLMIKDLVIVENDGLVNKNNTLDLDNFVLDTSEITPEDCQKISQWIIRENEIRGKHMIERSPEKILQNAIEYGFAALRANTDELIGFISLNEIAYNGGYKIYELGSLIKNPDVAIKGIGVRLLTYIIDDQNQNKILFAETNNSFIKMILESNTKVYKYSWIELPECIKFAYSTGTPVANEAEFYINRNPLYFSELLRN